jgi:hypothetical protein
VGGIYIHTCMYIHTCITTHFSSFFFYFNFIIYTHMHSHIHTYTCINSYKAYISVYHAHAYKIHAHNVVVYNSSLLKKLCCHLIISRRKSRMSFELDAVAEICPDKMGCRQLPLFV